MPNDSPPSDQLKQSTGFTIVELLIVIVVIAILASISIVAFNGIQNRAENNKTLSAANAYYKAIKMYEVDKGEVPHIGMDSCIGEDYKWDLAGHDSGVNQCIGHTSTYYTVKGTLNVELKKYISPLPEPSMKAIGIEARWQRGITYRASAVGGPMSLNFALKGTSDCPTVAGQNMSNSQALSGGVACNYIVGTRLR